MTQMTTEPATRSRLSEAALEQLARPSTHRPVPLALRYLGGKTVYVPTRENAPDLLASDEARAATVRDHRTTIPPGTRPEATFTVTGRPGRRVRPEDPATSGARRR